MNSDSDNEMAKKKKLVKQLMNLKKVARSRDQEDSFKPPKD